MKLQKHYLININILHQLRLSVEQLSFKMNGNTMQSVLQSFEEYIDSSQSFANSVQEILLPKLSNSAYNLHKLKENLSESIINYGNQRFNEGVQSVENSENKSISLVIESPKIKSQGNIDSNSDSENEFIVQTNDVNIKTVPRKDADNDKKQYEDKIKQLNNKINSLERELYNEKMNSQDLNANVHYFEVENKNLETDNSEYKKENQEYKIIIKSKNTESGKTVPHADTESGKSVPHADTDSEEECVEEEVDSHFDSESESGKSVSHADTESEAEETEEVEESESEKSVSHADTESEEEDVEEEEESEEDTERKV